MSVLHENEGQSSGPERSCTELGTPRLDETDLDSPARDDAKRITATDIMMNISKLHAGTSHGIKNGGYECKMQGIEREIPRAKCKGSKEKLPYGQELTVAIAVQRTPLNKRLECPSCMRTKVKTAVQSAPAWNWATPRLEETDLQSPARDDAEQITATNIMVNVSRLNA